jgi:hypothetical protein
MQAVLLQCNVLVFCRLGRRSERQGLFGKRLTALGGTMQDVADTPANAAEFSRPSNQYGPGLFPQIRLLVLTECGSHATVDATVSDGTHAERRLAEELLPSLTPDMFLVHDAPCPYRYGTTSSQNYLFWLVKIIRTLGTSITRFGRQKSSGRLRRFW